ncbi:PREDICTED: uncharacterized GPI-anchored protein At4g28100-like [Nicotiana attenuata]|uniref:Gpi-anchored protein n=1 Tax=Nicotiana attenuata TaxID=49451 RepID=A0A1J6J6J8_NICAT|nr:PREDICTED: uncharacterized GPI-anchored protein At4g28100-like [Nicotiana attenuata]OIT02849.1 putative gpi-anchored protein [Nicotiana attenuata]
MSLNCFFFFLTVLCMTNLTVLPAFPVLPEPDPTELDPQILSPSPSPPSTIPAFPEQSNIDSCPLDIPEELYKGIRSACRSNDHSGQINPTSCCPVLAAWLYSAYARTALHKAITKFPQYSTSVNMPVLPDDSETCVNSFGKALENRGIELVKPNETCDVVYCYCGIRLHPLSCPEAFFVNSGRELVGGERVNRLETECFSSNGYSGLAGCSKCLNSLYLLSDSRMENTSITSDRSRKMRSRDCQMMGLTWLLNKNTSGYIHTVSAVLRALMMSKDGSDPQSCTLSSDGLPLAVDSSEINDQSSATSFLESVYCYFIPFVLACINFTAFFL